MNMSRALLSFHHCDVSSSFLCLCVPEKCPLCAHSLVDSTTVTQLPCPLLHSFSVPYSIVIKPTQGTFLETYTRDCNLHIGICDSRGVVFDFDEKGVNRSLQGWDQCVAVHIEQTVTTESLWDVRLREFTCDQQWKAEKYDENSMNCYDFALRFLQLMQIPDVEDKHRFVESRLLPKTKQVAKYVMLYRKVVKDGVVVLQTTAL